ncbi:hypothetical protein PGH42_00030 [Legionella pneumophila]|nr:hypothetical protein PGH42_00030 [Legionella pneumophila]
MAVIIDSHLGFIDISDTWSEQELIPFSIIIQPNHCDMVMIAHIVNRKLDMTATCQPFLPNH